MIEGRKNILAWFESTGFAYWFIYPGKATDGGNWTAKSSESETATPGTALHELERTLQLLSGGAFTLVSCSVPKAVPKGMYKVEIRLSALEGQQQAAQAIAPTISGVPEDQVEKRIQQAVEAAMTRVKMEQLEQENKELKAELSEHEKTNPWNRIGNIIADIAPAVLPTIVGSNAAPVAKVAGLHAVEPQAAVTPAPGAEAAAAETITADQQKLENVIAIFSSIDPDGWLDKLETIAKKVQQKPSLLNMINLL